MAANPFIGGVNPPDLIPNSPISHSGALSGQLNARRTDPLISLRGGEVARLTFAGNNALDPFNVWDEIGLVPSGGLLTGAGVRESAGPFANSTRFELPPARAFHFPGDFSAAFVLRPGAAVTGVIFQDGDLNVSGYFIQGGTLTFTFKQNGAGVAATLTGTVLANTVNVVCVGAAGSTIWMKTNLNAATSIAGIAYVLPATRMAIGNGAVNNNVPLTADLYEAWFSTQTASDALFTAIATEVKTKLGITAW